MELDNDRETEDLNIEWTSQGITTIPYTLLQNVNLLTLNLSFNEIETIPSSLCKNLKVLCSLQLCGNEIISLPEDIGQLVTLNELSLNENMLTSLPQSIGGLKNLQKFNCIGNELHTLPNSVSELTNLKELMISENLISSLPENFGNLQHLEVFDISYNKLESLSPDFGNLTNLTNLNLTSNYIVSLPESFKNLGHVKYLGLSQNIIQFLPENFASSHCLQKFYADDNHLSDLPPWLSDAKNIIEISLKGNHIRDSPFPQNFGIANNKLKFLDLRGNGIVSLPAQFYLLESLEYLDLGSMLSDVERKRMLNNGNNLSELPVNFGNLKNLHDLHLDENWISKLPEDFGNLSNLVHLDLNHNSLSALPNSFCNLISLEMCLLSLNYLKELPEEFGCLKKLKELRLDSNQICQLPASFENLIELEVLDLYANEFKLMPPSLLKLKKLKHLYLDEDNFSVPRNEVNSKSSETIGDCSNKDNFISKNCKKDVAELIAGDNEGNYVVTSVDPLETLKSTMQTGSLHNIQHHESTEDLETGVPLSFQNNAVVGRFLNSESCQKYDKYSECTRGREDKNIECWDNVLKEGNSNDLKDTVIESLDNEDEEYSRDKLYSSSEEDMCTEDIPSQVISVLSTTQECWDEECNEYFDADKNESLFASDVEEDWDREVIFESHTEKTGTYKHPTKEKDAMFFFLPADQHPPQVLRKNTSWLCEDGQFEDADL